MAMDMLQGWSMFYTKQLFKLPKYRQKNTSKQLYININSLFLFSLFVLNLVILGCSKGVLSGSLSSQFAGVQNATILSPTSVKLEWKRSTDDIDYTVYMGGSSAPVKTLTFESVTIDNLQPSTTYKFKVVSRTASGSLGDDKEISVTTWPRFSGISKLSKDENGNFILQWDYNYPVKNFLVFYKTEKVPTALNTNSWATPDLVSNDQQIKFKDWQGAANYYFTVHVEYNSGEFERPNVVLDALANPNFPTTNIVVNVPNLTIGSLPIISVTPQIDATHPASNYMCQLYQGDTPISDPQPGAANLVVLPNANLSLGIVDNLNIHVTYNDGTINQTLIKKGYSTIIKDQSNILDTAPISTSSGGPGFMGKATMAGDFNCDGVDDLAVGLPDSSIATLGMTNSFAGVVYIYYSKAFSCGTGCSEFKLYTPALGAPQPSLNPNIPGVDPQVIAIADMPVYSNFGASLSKGNLNGDGVRNNGTFRACEDIIVGAPGMQGNFDPTASYTDPGYGSAFVFFGSAQGLKSPTSLSNISENMETCDGSIIGSTCNAVRLWNNPNIYKVNSITESQVTLGNGNGSIRFGSSVAFIGDINGDGFDDIAVGAPNDDWDDRVDNGVGIRGTYMYDVGSVTIYFGSKYGIGLSQIKQIDLANGWNFDCTSTSQKGCARAVKIYPPMPHNSQYFGSAIFGGVDVDGRKGPQQNIYTTTGELATKCTSTFPNVCYSTSDFVIGAPGAGLFRPNTLAGAAGTFGTFNGSSNPVRYISPQQSTYGSAVDKDWVSGTTNWNTQFSPDKLTNWGAVSTFGYTPGAGLPSSITGLAYLYFGMTDQDGSSALENYYSCSSRYDQTNLGGYSGATLNHFSCFTNGKNMRVLYPRDSTTLGFGAAVAMLGKKAKQIYNDTIPDWEDSANTAATTLVLKDTDPNKDGWGEIIVGAPNTTVSGKTNAGALWEFFGNPSREYDTSGYKSAKGGTPLASDYFQTANPNCQTFDTSDSVNANSYRLACKPMLIKLNSFNTGGYLAYNQNAMAVGDVSGDGLKDLIVGAPFDSSNGTNSGIVYIFTSNKTSNTGGIGQSNYKITKTGGSGIKLGSSVTSGAFEDPTTSSPSRLNSNGLPFISVAVGAPSDPTEKAGGGAVHLYKTNYSAFTGGALPTESLTDKLSSFQDLEFQSIKIVGDINNDGYDDAVGHTYYYNTTGNRVYQAFVYFGSPIGLITTEFCKNSLSRVFASGSDANECYPKSIHSSSAVTKTGILLPQAIPAPNGVVTTWARLQMGVGDVNGDGFDDVLFMDPSNAPKDGITGNMLLYFGSSNGLNTVNAPSFSPASSGDSQIVTSGYDFNVDGWVYINNNSMFNMESVAHGDFNGDGYEDLVLANPTSRSPNFGPWTCTDSSDLVCPGGGQLNYFGRVLIVYGSQLGYQTPKLKNSLSGDFLPIENGDAASNSKKWVNNYFYDPYNPLGNNVGSERLSSNNVVAGSFACLAGDCMPTVIWNPINVKDYIDGGTYDTTPLDAAYNKLNHAFGTSVAVLKPVLGGPGDSKYDSLIIGAPDYSDPGCFRSGGTSNLRFGRAYIFYGSDYGIRAFSRSEYYNPDPYSTSSCWANPSATQYITAATPVAPGNELKFHTNADDRNRIIVLQPPTKGGAAASTFNGKSRRFGARITTAGDLNADGVEDIVISDGGTGNMISGVAGQGWVYYGNLCDVENSTAVWGEATGNDDPLVPKMSVFGTKATFLAAGKTYANECYVNENAKKFLPHTFTIKGASSSNGDVYFTSLKSGRAQKGNFNGDGIDGYDDVIIGSSLSNDSISNSLQLGNAVVYFGSNKGLITTEIPQTFMSQANGSTIDKPLYKPFKIIPKIKINKARFFDASLSTGDINGDKAMDLLIPSATYSGSGSNKGVELGAFMLFY